MAANKKRWGDRRDAQLIRKADPLHFVMGVIYPNRADNEAHISERIDLTNIKEYLAKKNTEGVEFRYTFMHVILTAMVKTFTLRPKLNRFFANENYYQRNELTAAFVVKKQFTDHSEEGLAFFHAHEDDTVDTIHEYIRQQVTRCREEKHNGTDTSMDIINKMPRFLSKFVIHVLRWLDRHGWAPRSMVANDPNYSSIFISNLGSIHLKSGYHHLTNWGTNSFFCIIGEKKWSPVYNEEGFVKMTETLDLGFTVDERIADGYYYAKSIRLLKYLLQHPEELEKPLKEEVQYE